MKKIFSNLAIVLALMTFSMSSFAQITTPRPSPTSTVQQTVGITDISITYSRPGAKERKVYGDLVPYGKLWRTGANAATKISFGDEVKLNGNAVPAGEYSVFTIPGEKEWTIILNKDVTASTSKYDEAKDQLRFTAKTAPYAKFVESFTINFTDLRDDHANIQLLWEKTSVSFKIEVDVDAKVIKQIEEAMKGVSSDTYFQAGRYYYDTGRDMNQALEWVNKSLETQERFWMWRTKALIQIELKDTKGAIASLERSTALAKESGNDEYPKMNQKTIDEINKKK